MDLQQIIRSRRSIGSFTDQVVPLELIGELLETAVFAPNHRMTEPWRFVVITGAARHEYATIRGLMVQEKAKTQDAAEQQQVFDGTYQKFMSVPLYLLVIAKQHQNPEIRDEDYAACACVIQNFLLLATAQGLGTSWKTFKQDERLKALVGLQADETVVGIIHCGYPQEGPRTGQRQPAAQRLTVLDGA